MMPQLYDNAKGSLWHRWEPHIHVPGTILNNQYPVGEDAINEFCGVVEKADPPIRSLGITDYYSIVGYEKLLEAKSNGRLADVELLFANVELRFKIATSSDKAINGHLLFSPEDPNHIQEIRRFLHKLTFSTGLEVYNCQESDLIKLGKDHDPLAATTDRKALEIGTNQFKVDFDELIKVIKSSAWAQENLLIAVAGGSRDGSAGLQSDASFSSTRKNIERSSHIIFSSNEKQRMFWLGQGTLSKDQIIEVYNSCKPCLHGSDAHRLDDVGIPVGKKYSWIKGDLTFESLRQACIEPEDRAFVGDAPPQNIISSYVIERVGVSNAGWMNPNKLELNSGLITVIGARGSGKTALADMIAAGGYAISEQLSDTSFIRRAFEHLTNTSVSLDWQSGNTTTQEIKDTDFEDIVDYPRVQYLSQKFVDQLCSSEGMTDRLILEIEKVIFIAHPVEDRLGLSDFQDLLYQKSSDSRTERQNQQEIIEKSSEDITVERAKKLSLPSLEKRRDEIQKDINRDKTSRTNLLSRDTDSRMKRLAEVTSAFDLVSIKLENAQTKLRELNALSQSVDHARATVFPTYTAKLKAGNANAGLSEEKWNAFEVDFKGDVHKLLISAKSLIITEITKIKGLKLAIDQKAKETDSFIVNQAVLEDLSYEVLNQEVERLKKLIGIDTENAKQYSRISDRILKSENEIARVKNEIADADSAQERITNLIGQRKKAYCAVFAALLQEEKQLKDLYLPLSRNLSSQIGSLAKLSFIVRRQVDIVSWAQRGEDLLDLRKSGPFRGKGAMLDAVRKELKSAWEIGTAEEISEAIAKFRDNHEKGILEHAQYERKDKAEFAQWANTIAQWLYSTDHINISYGIIYDGVDIQQLSPGTRGIVLLLLYLAIDQEDDRPLIIDQPEENLDPKSIFEELVPLFKNAKKRRQIIIVTHNANLVVNTDADQVIIATVGTHEPGKLPMIHYQSGGLENRSIRNQVCEILEGGEAAFRERAKRLRVVF